MADIAAQHASIQQELDAAHRRVLAHGRFINGPEIAEFEQQFAAFSKADYCVGMSSGTDALVLALEAAGIGPGDEVVTTPFTFIATVEAIVRLGATPVLVDVDPDTALMTVDRTDSAIGERTAAILVVHLYGQTVDLSAFRALADRKRLLLIEDAAQAHGATHGSLAAGAVGDAATFSFFPGKNLGALGDAGAVTSCDAGIVERVRLLRDHGRRSKYEHEIIGWNARLDTLQAAYLLAKLSHLEGWNSARRANAAAYTEAFEQIEGVDPLELQDGATHVYHQYVVRAVEREGLADSLAERGIASAVHYPVPLHRQRALTDLFGDQSFPNSDRLAADVLSLPVYPELAPGDRDEIIEAVATHSAALSVEGSAG